MTETPRHRSAADHTGLIVTLKRPTLADVAKRAGASTAVVSYVMNNGPRPVSDRLRAKVIAAADELGYRPDRHAQALRRPRRWRQIGLLVPDMTMPLFGAFAGRVEIEARARDHLTMIGNTGFDPEREVEFAGAFTDVGIDGLIVVGAVDASETSRICARARIPVVWMHNSRGLIDSPIVGGDHIGAGRLAAQHLAEVHACERLVFVGGFTADEVRYGDRETVAERFEGFASVVSGAAIHTDLTAAGAYAAVSAYLRDCAAPPQGMVVGTSGQSAAAMRAVTDAGLDIPGDVRIAGFDAGAVASDTFGQITLTSVQQPIDAITRRALGRLLDDSRPAVAETARIETALTVGESCGCVSRTRIGSVGR